MFGLKKKNGCKLGVLATLTLAGLASQAFASADTLVLTPPLGWNSWNVFHENINENQIKEVADAMVESGLRDAGYVFLNLDDNWMDTKRDAQGNLQNNPKTFPSGMKALADYVHKKGLKFGLYGDRGKRTCHHYNSNWQSQSGSNGHEVQDAKKLAEWGVDYWKYDNCDSDPRTQEKDYTAMSNALRNSGRDIVFSICMWEYKDWMPKIANLWRTTFDIGPEWISTSWYRGVYEIIDANNKYWQIAKPGHWNDPDMLEVGNRGLSYEEQRSQMTMWSIMAAPIMISSDVRNMSNETKELYLNKDMIAINQDSLGVQGHRISDKQGKQVWTKPLKNGDIAVALLNNNGSTQTVECDFKDIGVEGEVEVRDAWKKKDLGPVSRVSIELPAHGSALLRLVVKPVPRGLFKGEAFAIPGKIEMEDFDINGLGQGNTTYSENDTENHGDSDYRKGTGVDLYEKATGIIVGYNQAGEWLEYTVNVKEAGDYEMIASVATENSTDGFSLSIDGKSVAEVPVSGSSWDDFTEVSKKVTLPEGEHILRFTVVGDWFDVDYLKFCKESCDEKVDLAKVHLTSFESENSYNVFSATGKHLGRVDLNGASMSQALENAGYARGTYMMRSVKGSQIYRVKVAK